MRFSGQRLCCSCIGALGGQEIKLFAIVWLRRGIVVETETSVLPSAAEAIAAAKLRHMMSPGAIPARNLTRFV
jgi:hypothetical protein